MPPYQCLIQLVHDYLAQLDDVTITSVPMTALTPAGTEQQSLQIVIDAQVDGSPRLPVVTVTVDCTGDQHLAADLTTLQLAVYHALADDEAWYEFFALESNEDLRTGYRLLKLTLPELRAPVFDTSARRVSLQVANTFRLAVF